MLSSTFSSEGGRVGLALRRLGVVGLFLFSLLVVDRLLGAALASVVANSQSRFARVYKGEEPRSILIFGNSRGADSFLSRDIASATGQATLNLSWMGVSTRLAQVLFEDYLRLNTRPALVVVEVSFLETPPDQQLAYLKPYTSRGFGLERYWCKQRPAECLVSQVASVFRFNALSTVHAMTYLNTDDQWRSHAGVISAALAATPWGGDRGAGRAPYALLEDNARSLREIADLCKKRGIVARFVVAPFLPAYVRGIPGMSDWKQRVQDITGERLWDYSEALDSSEFFVDRIHLNAPGARRFLELMLKDGVFAF